jgi:hypothetical protein
MLGAQCRPAEHVRYVSSNAGMVHWCVCTVSHSHNHRAGALPPEVLPIVARTPPAHCARCPACAQQGTALTGTPPMQMQLCSPSWGQHSAGEYGHAPALSDGPMRFLSRCALPAKRQAPQFPKAHPDLPPFARPSSQIHKHAPDGHDRASLLGCIPQNHGQ